MLYQLNFYKWEKNGEGGRGRRENFLLTKFISQHYTLIEKLLKTEKQLTLGRAGIFLGARFGALDNRCDNCKIEVQSYTVVILKPIPPRQFHTIKILCQPCRELHREEVKYYLALNR